MLHDLGKVILVLQFPDEYGNVMEMAEAGEITLYEMENEYFSTSHATVGAWVAAQWSFPKALTDVIAYHHKPQLSKVAPMETAIVHFSDILLRGRGFGFAGDYAVPPVHPSAWELVALTESDISEILKEAETLLADVASLSMSD